MPTKGCSRKPPSMMLLALLCSLVAAPRAFASPLAGLQDLAPQNLPIGASLGGFEFDYSPNPEYDEKAHYKIVNLFKRGCTLPQGGVCSDGAACCNNPNASGKGWCCNSGKLCGDGKDETYCMQSTVFTTTTTTRTNVITEGSAPVATRVPKTTETKTETWTTILTTTDLGAMTSTHAVFTTVTEDNNNKRRRAPRMTAPPAPPVETPQPRQQAVLPRATSASEHHNFLRLRDLVPRQSVYPKKTQTVTTTVTTSTTTSATGIFTEFYTETRTSTSTTTLTSTVAPSAQTTVTETWTFTIANGETAAPVITNSPPPSQSPNPINQDDGLSTGAKAGIGIGVSAVALAGMGVAAFLLYRRRKNRQLAAGRTGGNGGGVSGSEAPLDKPELDGTNTAYNNTPYEYAGYYNNNSTKPPSDAYAYAPVAPQGGAHELYAPQDHQQVPPQELPSQANYAAEMPGSTVQGETTYPPPAAHNAQGYAPVGEMSAHNYR